MSQRRAKLKISCSHLCTCVKGLLLGVSDTPLTPVREAIAIVTGIADPPTRSMRALTCFVILKYNYFLDPALLGRRLNILDTGLIS